MSERLQVVALSGGKDSTALALRLAELEPGPFRYLCTPTGDELPELLEHWAWLEAELGQPIERVTHPLGLNGLIEHFGALPNWRQRWCTRMLKIEPCLAYLEGIVGDFELCVGLRADEEERKGIYSEAFETRFPLREWEWGLAEVVDYCKQRGARIPERTDCARCYGQRVSEWWRLWKDHGDLYADAERQEAEVGNTFRSPQRDTWPAELVQLRKKFEGGARPRGVGQESLFDDGDACRVCKL